MSIAITEVTVKLAATNDPGRPRLLAYASVTLGGVLAVHDLKVIDGREGLFVAMPSKPMTVRCGCGRKCPATEHDCPACGEKLPPPVSGKRFTDVAHPICQEFRLTLEQAVLAEYRRVLLVPPVPGVVSTAERRES